MMVGSDVFPIEIVPFLGDMLIFREGIPWNQDSVGDDFCLLVDISWISWSKRSIHPPVDRQQGHGPCELRAVLPSNISMFFWV